MKKGLLLLPCLAAALLSISQTLQVVDTGNITRERWRDSMLRMDMQQVPTGFLLEYSLGGFDTYRYDGVNGDDDTLTEVGQLLGLYDMLGYSKVNGNAAILPADTLYGRAFLAGYNSTNAAVPLSFVHLTYNRIRQTALNEGLFTIAADSVGILDVPNRTTSPYDAYEFFAFAPYTTEITRFNSIPFTLPDELFLMPGITAVQVDFDDGAGYRQLARGGVANVYYATEGYKYLKALISTAGGTRLAICRIDYKRPATYTQPDYTWKIEADPYTGTGNRSATTQDFPAFNCNEGSFTERMLCSVNPNANVHVVNGCDGVFDKPIIIVEGFDPKGELTIEALIRRFTAMPANFVETMRAYGYDFVYVDFTKNLTRIESNANVLEAVINKVNQTKTGTNKISIIGFSMGGLITRWCLKDMEDRGLTHNVENYFSYDSPHQGANVPLGMQYIFKELIHDLPYARLISKNARLFDDAFKSEAARQMLVTYADYNNGAFNWNPSLYTLSPLRADFAQRLQAKGYPQQTHNYGISFGRGNNTANTKEAGNGNQFTAANPFGPQSEIFFGPIYLLLLSAKATAWAVPEGNVNAPIAHWQFAGITFRKIFGIPIPTNVTLRIRKFNYTGQYSYDDAMGSYEQTQIEVRNGWAPNLAGGATTRGHDSHNFLATVSALDLQNQSYSAATNWQSSNMFYNVDNQIQNSNTVSGNTLATPSLSPFEAVMTATSNGPNPTNGWHNQNIDLNTARFIERKILNAEPTDCGAATGSSICDASNSAISGPDMVCDEATYTLTNIPNGINIFWQLQNGSAVERSGQGTPIYKIQKSYNGTNQLTVTISNGCTSRTFTLPIFVGPTAKAYYNVSSNNVASYNNPLYYGGGGSRFLPKNQSVLYSIQIPYGNAYNASWSVSGQYSTYYSGSNFFNLYMVAPAYAYSANNANVTLSASGQCGSFTESYNFQVVATNNTGPGGGWRMASSPNPASDNLNVSIMPAEDQAVKGTLAKQATKERVATKTVLGLYDLYTNALVKRWSYTDNQSEKYNLSVSDVKPGYYVLKMERGGDVISIKIMIQ